MGEIIRLRLTDNHLVVDEMNERVEEIAEICVVYKTTSGVRRIIHGSLDDNFEWYGIMTALAHNMFLHNAGTKLVDE